MSHTITITRVPDEVSDDFEYEFGGTHGHDCGVLVRCARKACQAMNPDYGDERVRHGREHFFRDGDWLVESDRCALRYVFEAEFPWSQFERAGLGTHPVEIEWEDDWYLSILPATVDGRTETPSPPRMNGDDSAIASGNVLGSSPAPGSQS